MEEDDFLKSVQKRIDDENKEKEEYRIEKGPEIIAYSNNFLLFKYRELSGGDDYDGGFTLKGEVEFKLLEEELYKRLRECGFLRKEEG